MVRFVDRLVQDGIDAPIDLIVDPSERDLVDIRHKRLCHHWWAALRKRGGLPRRDEISAPFLAEIADHSVVLARQGDDFRYERFGRALARTYGIDMTGKQLGDYPEPVAKLFRAIYHLCEVKRFPVYSRHMSATAAPVDHWLRLIVPLDQKGGGQTTHLLGCSIAVKAVKQS